MDIPRYAAFSSDPAGGNPAGVVLDATGHDEAATRAVAAEAGRHRRGVGRPRRLSA